MTRRLKGSNSDQESVGDAQLLKALRLRPDNLPDCTLAMNYDSTRDMHNFLEA